MESTTRRTARATRARIATGICAFIVACSASNSASQNASTDTPNGATPITEPDGLTGCGGETEPPGCYAFNGTYTPPATSTCMDHGGAASGSPDTHCKGVTPQ